MQLAIGANGARYIGSEAGARKDFESFTSAVSVESNRWTAEVRIPWSVLKTTSDSKQAIPFNIARFRGNKHAYLTWTANRS